MTWFHGVAEREHDIQNPTSPEQIRLLGERLLLGLESQRGRSRARERA